MQQTNVDGKISSWCCQFSNTWLCWLCQTKNFELICHLRTDREGLGHLCVMVMKKSQHTRLHRHPDKYNIKLKITFLHDVLIANGTVVLQIK